MLSQKQTKNKTEEGLGIDEANGIRGILNEISKIESQKGISFVTALLLNELMKKEGRYN